MSTQVPNEVGIDLAWSSFDGCNSPYKVERAADQGATNLLSCTHIYQFHPHNLTSILLEHLLLRPDPVLSQVLPFCIFRRFLCMRDESLSISVSTCEYAQRQKAKRRGEYGGNKETFNRLHSFTVTSASSR
jgi:hypothetical protein